MRPTRTGISGLIAVLGTLLAVAGPAAAQSLAPTSRGVEIIVPEGEDTLHAAVAQANSGDTLVLRPGLYEVTRTVVIDKNLTIRGATKNPADVHIAAIGADDFDFEVLEFPSVLDRGHILFVKSGAQSVTFRYFTIKNAPETDISELECEEDPPFGFGLNHSECFGDGIHADGVAEVLVDRVDASLNAGNGIWVDGASLASFSEIRAVNNGAFGIDVDTAQDLRIERSSFVANQISGVEASGHAPGLARGDYTATALITNSEAIGNGEIGIEVERFHFVTVDSVSCRDNREDGFDADRVSSLKMSKSSFTNNLDDGIELFPAGTGVPPEEQPADFPGSTVEVFKSLTFSGNVGEDIDRPPTED